jgi:hypothetical protein
MMRGRTRPTLQGRRRASAEQGRGADTGERLPHVQGVHRDADRGDRIADRHQGRTADEILIHDSWGPDTCSVCCMTPVIAAGRPIPTVAMKTAVQAARSVPVLSAAGLDAEEREGGDATLSINHISPR